MAAVDVLETLELVGSTQRGLVSTAQAREAGVSKMALSRLAARGTLRRVRHGVYALPSADAGPLQDVRAAWLAAGGESTLVVSGASAAAAHGLGDLVPAKHEFTTASRRQTSQPDIRFRKGELGAGDVTRVDGLPVTTVVRTVADLARAATDVGHLAALVGDAIDRPDTTATDLVMALEPAAARFGHGDGASLLKALLTATGYRPDAALVGLVTADWEEMVVPSGAPVPPRPSIATAKSSRSPDQKGVR